MNLKILSNENLIGIRRNLVFIKEKELDNDKYLMIQGLYQKALDYIILNNSSVKQFDDKIFSSDLKFGLIDEERKDIHHKISYMNLNYIYVRNFLFIEKLTVEHINYILNKVNNKDFEIDDTLIEIVKKTFKEVINDNYRKNKYIDNTNTFYGSFIPENIVPSDSLVFCIHYGKNPAEIKDSDFWYNYELKQEFLSNIIKEMEETLKKELLVDVKVLIRTYVGE